MGHFRKGFLSRGLAGRALGAPVRPGHASFRPKPAGSVRRTSRIWQPRSGAVLDDAAPAPAFTVTYDRRDKVWRVLDNNGYPVRNNPGEVYGWDTKSEAEDFIAEQTGGAVEEAEDADTGRRLDLYARDMTNGAAHVLKEAREKMDRLLKGENNRGFNFGTQCIAVSNTFEIAAYKLGVAEAIVRDVFKIPAGRGDPRRDAIRDVFEELHQLQQDFKNACIGEAPEALIGPNGQIVLGLYGSSRPLGESGGGVVYTHEGWSEPSIQFWEGPYGPTKPTRGGNGGANVIDIEWEWDGDDTCGLFLVYDASIPKDVLDDRGIEADDKAFRDLDDDEDEVKRKAKSEDFWERLEILMAYKDYNGADSAGFGEEIEPGNDLRERWENAIKGYDQRKREEKDKG